MRWQRGFERVTLSRSYLNFAISIDKFSSWQGIRWVDELFSNVVLFASHRACSLINSQQGMGTNAKATPDSRNNGTNGFRRNVLWDRSGKVAAAWHVSPSRTFSLGRSESCIECHRQFYHLWAPSRHWLAMQPDTPGFARANLTPPKKKMWSSASIGIGRISVSKLNGCCRPTLKARRKNSPSSMY